MKPIMETPTSSLTKSELQFCNFFTTSLGEAKKLGIGPGVGLPTKFFKFHAHESKN